jgi:hypothetical protein
MELEEPMETMKRTEASSSDMVKEEKEAPVSKDAVSSSIQDDKAQEPFANEESDSTDSDDDDEGDDDEGGEKEDASGTFQIPQRFTKSGRKRSVPFPVRVSVSSLASSLLRSIWSCILQPDQSSHCHTLVSAQ